jgi:hypothetical protein
MRFRALALIVLAACFGVGTAAVPAVAAAPAIPAPVEIFKRTRPKLHQATGELLSLSSNRLLLLHARGRLKQRMVFVLTPQTKKEGVFVKGERIRVYYYEGNGRLIVERMRRAPVPHAARSSGTRKP